MTLQVPTAKVASEPDPGSLPAWLAHQARQRPQAIALRHKRFGTWNAITWRDADRAVRRLTRALARKGFGAGDGLLLLSRHPSPPAVFAALAAQWLGGVAIAIDPLAQRAALPAIFEHLQARFVLVDDDRSAHLIPDLDPGRRVALVIQADTRAVASASDGPLRSYDDLIAENASDPTTLVPGPVTEDETAFVLVRAGEEDAADGQPLVHRLTHQELLRHGRQLVQAQALHATDETFVSRSFATAGHARYVIAPWLLAGFRLNFPESLATRDRDRREISPTVLVGTGASYGRLARLVHDELSPPSNLRCRIAAWALGRPRGALASLTAALLVHRPLRDLLGLAKTRVPLLVGEPADAATQALYESLGVPLRALPDPADFRPTRDLRPQGDALQAWRWHESGARLSLSGGGAT